MPSELAGGEPEIVHVNQLRSRAAAAIMSWCCRALSYADALGAGRLLALICGPSCGGGPALCRERAGDRHLQWLPGARQGRICRARRSATLTHNANGRLMSLGGPAADPGSACGRALVEPIRCLVAHAGQFVPESAAAGRAA
jgi:hypothetical protein